MLGALKDYCRTRAFVSAAGGMAPAADGFLTGRKGADVPSLEGRREIFKAPGRAAAATWQPIRCFR